MAATDIHRDLGFAHWLQAQLDAREWRQADLIRASDGQLTSGQLSRWLDGIAQPRMSAVRKVCEALGLAPVEGMIAAGMLSADDVGATVIQRPDVRLLSNAELLAEIGRRMSEPAFVSAPRVPEHDTLERADPAVDTEHDASMTDLLRALQASVNAARGGPSLLAINAYVEEEDAEGHARLVRIDPRRFGWEGEDWAARRRADESDKPAAQG